MMFLNAKNKFWGPLKKAELQPIPEVHQQPSAGSTDPSQWFLLFSETWAAKMKATWQERLGVQEKSN